MRFKRYVLIGLAIAVWAWCWGVYAEDPVSSRAYKGHANDQDMANLVTVYPEIVGTRLDDCQACHTSGTVTSGGRDRHKNSCDFCHYIPFPDDEATGQPETFEQTLNAYGLAYNSAGRDVAALRAIGAQDSDVDGASNDAEVADGKYPGDAGSRLGQRVAPMKILDMADLRALPSHSQFLLANSHKQQFDFYASYTGVRVVDLLAAVGVDPTEIDGITVIAPDGYMKDFSSDAIAREYPKGMFFWGLGPDGLGTDCGFVEYSPVVPEGLSHGDEIPDEPWLMLAYDRDGEPVEPSYLDPTSGKINGSGPLRIIVPQSTPGAPDRGSTYSPTSCDDGYDYDDNKDHNAGLMVRGVIAIRINPTPEGYEEFDHMNGGWAYADAGQLVLYGTGVEGEPTAVEIEEGSAVPGAYELEDPYPNPFNSETMLRFSLAEEAQALLRIYNAQGQRIRTLVDGTLSAGRYNVSWDATNDRGTMVASGLYTCELESPVRMSRRMVFLK